MGGNAFEDAQKLTPEEYQKITQQLLQMISPLCQLIEPYIPFPEKQVHGDIDFLLLFKKGFDFTHIIERMKLSKQEYIINNNLTANTIYHKKQVDFNMVLDAHEFELCKFYKSYGGIGALLGLLLPSKLVKFSQEGISCCCYHQHLKLEYNVCSEVSQILLFYGLDKQRYAAGFTTRKQLYQFLLHSKYLDTVDFKTKKPKWITKLINGFQQFLISNPQISNPFCIKPEDPVAMTLKHFKKEKEFEEAWQQKLSFEDKKKERAHKWNGKHIIDYFGVPSKGVNNLKKKFETFFGSKEKLEEFIDSHKLEDILELFSKVCQLKLVQKKEG